MALFQKLSEDATIPVRGTKYSAGYDLFALEETFVLPYAEECLPTKIKTGIRVNLPPGHCGQFWERSSLGSKGLALRGGLIDEDYQGELIVCLYNFSDKLHQFKKGDKIAQMVIVPYYTEGDVVNVVREGGFGSTGL